MQLRKKTIHIERTSTLAKKDIPSMNMPTIKLRPKMPSLATKKAIKVRIMTMSSTADHRHDSHNNPSSPSKHQNDVGLRRAFTPVLRDVHTITRSCLMTFI